MLKLVEVDEGLDAVNTSNESDSGQSCSSPVKSTDSTKKKLQELIALSDEDKETLLGL